MKPCPKCGSPFYDGIACPSCYDNSKALAEFEGDED